MSESQNGDLPLVFPGGRESIPRDWEWRVMDSLCEGVFDCPHSTPKITTTGPLMARTQDIISGIFRTSEAARVSEDTYKERIKRAQPSWGDLLYSREGTYFGIAAEVPKGVDVCLGQRMVLIRPIKDSINHQFLRYWLNSPLMQSHIHGLRDGSVAQRLNLPSIRNLPVAVPRLHEQDAIAAALGALDDKIAVNECVADTGRQLGLSLYKQATTQEPRSISIEDLSSYLNRGQAPKYTQDENGMTVLNQKCVRGGRVQLAPARLTLAARVHEIRRLQPGDVLVNSTGVGTLGRVSLWSQRIEATVDSHVTIVRINPEVIPPIVGGFAMLSAQRHIEAMGEGSTGQTELSKAKLGQLEIDIPSGESDVLADRLTALEEKADAALTESRALAELRDTLLPQLMSGKLRVKDAEKIVEDNT